MAVCDAVVVGSYPPMPGPATAATLGAVRREWGSGSTVRVVSFRPGAADISVAVAGPLAGWRLEQVRRHYGGPGRLVLVLQAGVPFSDLRLAQQAATAAGLVAALRRWEHKALVVGEDPGLVRVLFRALAGAVDEVVAASDEAALGLSARYRLPPGVVKVEEIDPYPPLPPGVEQGATGLYRPRGARALTLVDMPTTTLLERARARAHLPQPALVRRLRGR
ncbi:MAG: hypothetical protein ACRDZX_00345 [Acidimicrobiales bacterium]